MGFIEGAPVPKRIPEPSFLFQILSCLDISSQQAKFELKSIVSSISVELPLIDTVLTVVQFVCAGVSCYVVFSSFNLYSFIV